MKKLINCGSLSSQGPTVTTEYLLSQHFRREVSHNCLRSLVLVSCFESLMGTISGPDRRFSKDIENTAHSLLFTFLELHLNTHKQPREDYRNLLDLTKIFVKFSNYLPNMTYSSGYTKLPPPKIFCGGSFVYSELQVMQVR